ncbi:MBOAT family O-acyltransferase [Tissierella sp.]|uniref:MBOAT family O-acyltransferase n=1 Tax=Tissierella sp. TaxID=41274 RepID=UPI0028655376|nr:MBOAT family O-acyltransferase [Tissierella sp.]MDR7857564.1 MBOAT family O-acyltransferase [Tissierella sp.]
MLFSSLIFLFVFLPLSILIYYISPRKLKNLVLLTFSLFFYGYGEPKYLIVMLFSIGANYLLGLLVHIFRESKSKLKLVLIATALVNLGIIGYYKYADFIITNINAGLGMSLPIMNIIMPIGISFFTFQGMSYVIDVYRGEGVVQKNPLNVALYISLFPQLIAGPIVRYETVAEQINYREETLDGFTYGIERFILGLSKKVLIANTVGLIADEIFNSPINEMSTLLAWIGILSYTFQIYFDFSGYSDMAIGLGNMFGFKFLENFNYPYISKSVSEFWRRWHISLSTWFRDYVYIPLGGNRVNSLKYLRNIIVVWFLTGLWHGAAWNFIAWGLYYGVILIIEKFIIGKYLKELPNLFQHIYTMIFVILGWLLFRSENITYAYNYFMIMIGQNDTSLISQKALYYLMEYKFELGLAFIASFPLYPMIIEKIDGKDTFFSKVLKGHVKPILLMGLLLTCTMYLINSTFNPFIYFRF